MRFVFGVCLALMAGQAAPQSLRDALDAAWARHPEARLLDGRAAELAARREAARSFVPSPGAVSLSGRTDRFHRDLGAREYEVEVGMPVWLSGQRAAQIDLTERESAELEARRRAFRLALAAEIREAWIGLETSRAEAALADERAGYARALEQDVRRRLRAGDVSRLEANLAETERLAAEELGLQAAAKLLEAEQALRALTGLERHGRYPDEDAAAGEPPEHPTLAARRSGVATGQARVRSAAAATRENPELALFMQRERGGFDEPFAHSVGIRVKIPFAGGPRTQAQVAAAQAELDQAGAELAQSELRVSLERERAQRELAAAEQQARLAQSRRALALENLRLARRAYDLGESDLVTFLRIQSAGFEAERDAERGRLAVLAARGRLNQALGVLP